MLLVLCPSGYQCPCGILRELLVVKYLFTYLLGIQRLEPGYKSVRIDPAWIKEMNCAEGYITTGYGKIAVKYDKRMDDPRLEIEIPEHVSAVAFLEGREVPLRTGKNILGLS